MNEGRPAGRPFESLTLISKDFTRAQRNSLAKIFFKTGDHEIGQAFVVTFDVSVVGEIGHDDQAKRFGKRFKSDLYVMKRSSSGRPEIFLISDSSTSWALCSISCKKGLNCGRR